MLNSAGKRQKLVTLRKVLKQVREQIKKTREKIKEKKNRTPAPKPTKPKTVSIYVKLSRYFSLTSIFY